MRLSERSNAELLMELEKVFRSDSWSEMWLESLRCEILGRMRGGIEVTKAQVTDLETGEVSEAPVTLEVKR